MNSCYIDVVWYLWNLLALLLNLSPFLKFIYIIVQRDATQSSLFIILQVHSTCFRCQPHPSSGTHKTVTTASGTGHIFCAATSLQGGQAWPPWREVAANIKFRILCLYLWFRTSLICMHNCPTRCNTKQSPWREVAAQKIWPVPEVIFTVLCVPYDGCGWHPKHVSELAE